MDGVLSRRKLAGLPPGAAAWAVALAVFVPVCGVLLAEAALELVVQREALAGVAGGVSAAATLGVAGYVGQRFGVWLAGWPGPSCGLVLPGVWWLTESGPCGTAGEDWPVLTMLLFAPIVILFSGLGGWV